MAEDVIHALRKAGNRVTALQEEPRENTPFLNWILAKNGLLLIGVFEKLRLTKIISWSDVEMLYSLDAKMHDMEKQVIAALYAEQKHLDEQRRDREIKESEQYDGE